MELNENQHTKISEHIKSSSTNEVNIMLNFSLKITMWESLVAKNVSLRELITIVISQNVQKFKKKKSGYQSVEGWSGLQTEKEWLTGIRNYF